MESIREHHLFRLLFSLELPTNDYVIAGSAPMLAHGLPREISDLDVVARLEAWTIALRFGDPTDAPLGYAKHIILYGDSLEILNGWFDYDINSLIAESEVIDGVNFTPLVRVLEWKSWLVENDLDRDKDKQDISLIRDYLE
ncbi:hypothetical protein [Actinacidiphila acididurans]|uniref:Uncharacterized protein n=1 Tax=Actinacidiphila acididurans TaxID=2784346 RepID=A0ABS2TPX4_9ACTN|nr:hypothetical protein [Actinacidiphila acididurans]MBM9504566.1 hypothetical protein [Actinacidiphila acididurans]